MEILLYSLFSGIIGWILSILFRLIEIKNKTFYLGRQMIVQVLVFFLFVEGLKRWFSWYELNISFIHLNSFWLFFIVNSLGYFMTKIVFEAYSGISFLPADKEVEEYIKRQNEEMK
jgi:hypothetical protein